GPAARGRDRISLLHIEPGRADLRHLPRARGSSGRCRFRSTSDGWNAGCWESRSMNTCSHGVGAHAHADTSSTSASPRALDRAAARATAAPFSISPVNESERQTRITKLKKLLEERIVLLDGAMGTMIQREKLDEQAFRGERFRDYGRDIKGNNDLLVLTRPEL